MITDHGHGAIKELQHRTSPKFFNDCVRHARHIRRVRHCKNEKRNGGMDRGCSDSGDITSSSSDSSDNNCISNDNGVELFRSKIESALDNAIHAISSDFSTYSALSTCFTPWAPKLNHSASGANNDRHFAETLGDEWMMKLNIALRTIHWQDLFAHHNEFCRAQTISTTTGAAGRDSSERHNEHKPIQIIQQQTQQHTQHIQRRSTPLGEICNVILNSIWKKQFSQLNQLANQQTFKKRLENNETLPRLQHFHKSRLENVQHLLLDLWMEHQPSPCNTNSITHTTRVSSCRQPCVQNGRNSHPSCHVASPQIQELLPSDALMFQLVVHLHRLCLQPLPSTLGTLATLGALGALRASPSVPNIPSLEDTTNVNHATQAIWSNIILQYTQVLASEIRRLFHTKKKQIQQTHQTTFGSGERQRSVATLMTKCTQWVAFLTNLAGTTASDESATHRSDQSTQQNGIPMSRVRESISDSLTAVLASLDDADVSSLMRQHSEPKPGGGGKRGKRRGEQFEQMQPGGKKRGRIPSRVDALAALHESAPMEEDSIESSDGPACGGTDGEDAGHEDSSKFVLGNADRQHRAKRMQFEQHAVRQVLNSKGQMTAPTTMIALTVPTAQIASTATTTPTARKATTTLTTLPYEAAVLRRDIYWNLANIAELDFRGMEPSSSSSSSSSSQEDGNDNQLQCRHCTDGNYCSKVGIHKIHSTHGSKRYRPENRKVTQPMISNMVHQLLQRLTDLPSSPSTRLSSILILDRLREIHLGDLGYWSLMDGLLDLFTKRNIHAEDDVEEDFLTVSTDPMNGNMTDDLSFSPLGFYAEIIAECDAFGIPSRLLPALTKLMKNACHLANNEEFCDRSAISQVLRAISHIMVRRQNVLSNLKAPGLNHQSHSSVAVKEYNQMIQQMSVTFGSLSHWIDPIMSDALREKVVSVLQAEGILSLLCDSDDENSITNDESSPSNIRASFEYPFPAIQSLRSAHTRMGPCEGFNLILSHPSSYLHSLTPLAKKRAAPTMLSPCNEKGTSYLSNAHSDILHHIFSFLGYRSLTRASQCCSVWKTVSRHSTFWIRLYFRKFQKAYFEEELLAADGGHQETNEEPLVCFKNVSERMEYALSLGYNWFHLFKQKYTLQKKLRPRYDQVGVSSKRPCDVIGCLVGVGDCGSDTRHRRKHCRAAEVQARKLRRHRLLHKKVKQLENELCTLEEEIGLKSIHPLMDGTMQRAPKGGTPVVDIDGPATLLQCLVFPFLDVKDLLLPVCKLWKQLGENETLWRDLYIHHFGVPCTKWLTTQRPTSNSSPRNLSSGSRTSASSNSTPTAEWKTHFRQAFEAQKKFMSKESTDKFGWPVQMCRSLECHTVLSSKFEFDQHLLKHKEEYYLHRVKMLKGVQNGTRRNRAKKRMRNNCK